MSSQEFGVVAGGFVIVPHELLDEAPDGSVVLVYISLYRHGHGSREGCWCSQQRLSQESGVYLKGVRKALLWLEENGWVQGDHRTGRTAIYRVITQRHLGRNEPRSKTTQVENALGGRSKTTQVPRSKTTYEQKPSNKNPRTKNQEDPLTPQPRPRGTRADGTNPRAQGTNPRAQGRNLRAQGTNLRAQGTNPRAQRIDPATAPLPEALEQHRQAIADFWAAKRSGSARTATAFTLLVKQLERIQAADPSAVAEQLDAATQAGWSSITYANWERYGRRETRATQSGSHRTLPTRPTQGDYLERALARLDAGITPFPSSTLLNAEVLP